MNNICIVSQFPPNSKARSIAYRLNSQLTSDCEMEAFIYHHLHTDYELFSQSWRLSYVHNVTRQNGIPVDLL